jgi:hypothetical protein
MREIRQKPSNLKCSKAGMEWLGWRTGNTLISSKKISSKCNQHIMKSMHSFRLFLTIFDIGKLYMTSALYDNYEKTKGSQNKRQFT